MAAQGSYPHPVVGHHDDVESIFEIAFASVIPTAEDIELRLRVRLTDPDLRRLIDERNARLVVRWSCPATLSTGILEPTVVQHHGDGETLSATLDQQDVRDSVQVEVRVVAACEITGYSLSHQHPDYGHRSFSVRAGDVLGVAGEFEFLAEKLFDPLRPTAGSCFRLVDDPSLAKGLAVNFMDDDQVVVSMSLDTRSRLQQLGDHPSLQVALVVLPALMETIDFIRRSEESAQSDESHKRWYRTVLDLVTKVGGLQEPAIMLAQRILDHPIDKAVVASFTDEENDE